MVVSPVLDNDPMKQLFKNTKSKSLVTIFALLVALSMPQMVDAANGLYGKPLSYRNFHSWVVNGSAGVEIYPVKTN